MILAFPKYYCHKLTASCKLKNFEKVQKNNFVRTIALFLLKIIQQISSLYKIT